MVIDYSFSAFGFSALASNDFKAFSISSTLKLRGPRPPLKAMFDLASRM